jgi:hypothetical protein
VIHRDVAARNVLVGKAATDVKLADLGAARNVHRTSEAGSTGVYIATANHAPARWMALEALREAKFSHKSDVFAFGVLLWEMLTLGQTPWGAFGVPDFSRALAEGKRLAFPLALKHGLDDAETHSATTVFAIAGRCWNGNPVKRPHFHQLEAEFAVHCTVQAMRTRATYTAPDISGAVGGMACSGAATGGYLAVGSREVEQRPTSLDADGYVADTIAATCHVAAADFDQRGVLDADGYFADTTAIAGATGHFAAAAFGQRVVLDADGYVDDCGTKAVRSPNRPSGGDTMRDGGDTLQGHEQASDCAEQPSDFAQLTRYHTKYASSENGGSVADYAQLDGNRTAHVSSCESSSINTATEVRALNGVATRRARKPSVYLGFGQHPPNGDGVDDNETRL